MGTFLFRWEAPAGDVFVTGTFDNWAKSEQLIKTGDVFEKEVALSATSIADKIYYKFVVDGNWVTNDNSPSEKDAAGNLNNVLTSDRVTKHTPKSAGIISNVTPSSTTAALAKDVPLEKTPDSGSSDLPGTFPETPAAVEKGGFSVNPLPAADGAVNPISLAPGQKVPDPSSFTSKTVASGVHDDPELVAADKKTEGEQSFGVSPLPAFPGAVNPVKVEPGQKLPDPSTLTGNIINSTVRTDRQSYENGGALQNASEKDTGDLDLPPVSKNMIPESSLPIGPSGVGSSNADVTIQSAGPQSTTAQLAANVPLESKKVPDIVKESQKEAGVGPEASAIPAEVKDKSAMEKELLSEVPTAQPTSESGGKGSGGGIAASVGATALAAGGAAAAYASDAKGKLPESVQNSINSINTGSNEQSAAKNTPQVVKESFSQSGQSPEAATNEQAVLEKKAVVKKLLSEVKPENSTGESAPKIASNSFDAPSEQRAASRDVSPHTQTEGEGKPIVTSGVKSTPTDVTSGAPSTPAKEEVAETSTKAQNTPASKNTESPTSSTATEKKKKRTSIFGKLKAKFSDKH